MKNILNWPGIIGRLPLLSALLIGLTAAVFIDHPCLAASNSSDDITLARYAEMFDLNSNNAVSPELNQALLNFQFTDGDVLLGLWPWLKVFKIGGAWGESVNAWYVPAGEVGKLVFCLDRSRLQQNLIMEIEFFDGAAGGSMFVDLVDSNEEVLLSSQAYENGNLIEGSEEVVTKALFVPLVDYPLAAGLQIRGIGEVFVLAGALSLLESGRASRLGEPILDGPDEESRSGERRLQADVAAVPANRESGVAAVRPNRKPAGLQSRTIKATPLKQFVQALMSDGGLQISRYALSAGGTRLSSANFVMQATLGQPVAGFMTSSDYRLHIGFQQTVLILPQILNVGVVPSKFNPDLGEIATLSYILDVASTGVTVEVAKGLVTNTLVSAEYQGDGLNTLNWSGTNSDGTPATPGNWTFRITAACTGQTTSAVAQVKVDNNMPVIRAVSDEPELFCPTQGLSRIYYTTDEANDKDLDVRISLEDAESNLVTAVTYPDQPVGAHTQEWSGTDAALFGPGGSFMPNGIYRYRLNASRPGRPANEKTGVIVLACDTVATNRDDLVELRYRPDGFTVAITRPTGSELKEAMFALITAEPSFIRQSPIYEIKADPGTTTFAPPALLTFKYDPELTGDLTGKLQLRRYDTNTAAWVVLPHQAVDFVHHQVVAEVTNLASFYALFSSGGVAPAGALVATVRLAPEVLKVNPGILTAFVSLPEGYAESGIIAATCDGAVAESLALSADGTEMAIEFRRRAIEAALVQQGETLDTHFVVEVTWQGAAGTLLFRGEADIRRIVN